MIVVEHLHKQFGGIHAVNDVSLTVEQGTITGLIGPNGAGKTTLFNVIAGVYPPTAGHIYLENEEITGLKPHQLFAKGLLRTFQICPRICDADGAGKSHDGPCKPAGRTTH